MGVSLEHRQCEEVKQSSLVSCGRLRKPLIGSFMKSSVETQLSLHPRSRCSNDHLLYLGESGLDIHTSGLVSKFAHSGVLKIETLWLRT